jgi:peptidoglycan/LPS O-acetylase OafA/YrhL
MSDLQDSIKPIIKVHYRDLDALRGIAALSVAILHFGEAYDIHILPNAYLEVDFFFILSGFVIAYAYEDRLLRGYGLRAFMAQRVIRLYPLIIFGAIIGGLGAAIRLRAIHEPIDYQLFGAILCGALLVPSPVLQDAGNGSYFPINSPTWSLFWEVLINLGFGISTKYLTLRVLALIVVGSGLAFVPAEMSGLLRNGWDVQDFWFGIVRVLFSFSAGVLLFRLRPKNWLFPITASPLALSLVLIAVFAIPSQDVAWSNAVNCVIVMCIFPILVVAGSHAKSKQSSRITSFLGRISYPVYVLQFPFVRIAGHWSRSHQFQPTTRYCFLFVTVSAIVLWAWLVLVKFDEPVRSRLSLLSRNGFGMVIRGVRSRGKS